MTIGSPLKSSLAAPIGLDDFISFTPAIPANTFAPVVTGGTDVGDVLSVSTGTWTGYPRPTYTYQWQRDEGSGFANISGATSQTYTTVAGDDNDDIRCVVTATNSEGSDSANSNTVSIVDVSAPVNTVAPALSGAPMINSELTVSTGTWTGVPTPTYAYQWQLDTGAGFADIVGETTNAYTPLSANEGDDLRCVVTASNSEGTASANSDAQTIVDLINLDSLFAASEVGGYYSFQDLTKLKQNSDGTGDAAVGSPVGYVEDLSGNDNHATQPTSSRRPTLRQDAGGRYYLEFDGVDDALVLFAGVVITEDYSFGVAMTINDTGTQRRSPWGPTVDAVGDHYFGPLLENGSLSFGFSGLGFTATKVRYNGTDSTETTRDGLWDDFIAAGPDVSWIYEGTATVNKTGINQVFGANVLGTSRAIRDNIYGLFWRKHTSHLTSEMLADADAWLNQERGA